MAVSGVLSKNSLKQISLSLQLPENVFVGERVFVKISMKNTKRIFPSFSINVEDPAASRRHSPLSFFRKPRNPLREKTDRVHRDDQAVLRQSAYFPILRAGETRTELIIQSFPKRGVYTLDGFWISTRFPFGFFRRGQRVHAKGEVLVYPPVREIPAFFDWLPFLPGILEGNRVGPGENLFSMRRYQDGETARIIDWKATSKTGALMAREFALDEESKFCLILDTRIHGSSAGEEDFEKAVSLAASIASHFIQEGAGMEFLAPGEYLARGAGSVQLYRILRLLATIAPRKSPLEAAGDLWETGSFGIGDIGSLQQILSDKVFKIILTSQPRGMFPSGIWRSSQVIYFDEL